MSHLEQLIAMLEEARIKYSLIEPAPSAAADHLVLIDRGVTGCQTWFAFALDGKLIDVEAMEA